MGYYLKSIIPIIESNYDNFTTMEKQIADFFIKNRTKMDFSARSVANMLYVSEASLSRFAKKCGYRGYREFIYQYEENFVEKKAAMTGNTRLVLNTYQELLNRTYNLVDESQLVRIRRYMSKAGRVIACGIGSSGLAAREMKMRFMRVGVDIEAIIERDLMRMQAMFLNETSLAVGISLSGEKEEVLFFLQEAHKRRAKTVLVTAKNKDSLAEFCDEVVLVPSLIHLNHGNVISPQFPVLVMLDIWYSYYVEEDKYQKEVLHDSTLKALHIPGPLPEGYE